VFCALSNSVGTFLFIGTTNYYLMVLGRAFSGLSQAIICTYIPVWINEFAQRSRQTMWMGLSQAMGILGGVTGAVIGSMAADNKELGIASWFTWRTTLLFPASYFLKASLTWSCCPNSILDTQAREKEEQAQGTS